MKIRYVVRYKLYRGKAWKIAEGYDTQAPAVEHAKRLIDLYLSEKCIYVRVEVERVMCP